MNKDKIIKAFEKSAGFRICYWCASKIPAGKRILLSKEYSTGEVCPQYRVRVIGAVCSKCFRKYTCSLNHGKQHLEVSE